MYKDGYLNKMECVAAKEKILNTKDYKNKLHNVKLNNLLQKEKKSLLQKRKETVAKPKKRSILKLGERKFLIL